MKLTIEATEKGVRIDKYLSEQTTLTRSRIQQLITQEQVLVDGQPTKSNYKLTGGEQITSHMRMSASWMSNRRTFRSTFVMKTTM